MLITASSFAIETNATEGDTTQHTAQKKSFLEEKVNYSASDSMQIDNIDQKAYLYNNAVVIYEDLNLKAGYIEIDFKNNTVFATTIKDSSGKAVQRPLFEQGGNTFTAKKITYNFTTKKGKIIDVITQQGEGYIHGRDIKKDSGNVYNIGHGKYTTCDLEHPHFFIGAEKIQMLPDDKIITGPAALYIADIPTPLVLPFGYFPNKKGRTSGILMPQYGETENQGFFLKDFGYYFGGSEYVDLALRGDIYSNGSYAVKSVSNYKKRYRYNGGLSFNFSEFITGDRELPNSTTSKDYAIRWTHTQDPKSQPNGRFSALVNAASPSYNKYNGTISGGYLTNTLQSNVSYSKTFPKTPFNFVVNGSSNQNSITKQIDLSLPEFTLNMNRIYPFKNKNIIGNKWYDKLGISTTVNAKNQIHSYDSLLFENTTLDRMNNGIHFTIPISTSVNVLKYFTFTPAINTSSNIYFKSILKSYDATTKTVITDTLPGTKLTTEYNLSGGLSTRFYGNYFFKSNVLKQIRHAATPTITASYHPDYGQSKYGYYKNVQVDSTGKEQQYSIFQYGIYGTPQAGKSGTIGLSLNNALEAKIRQNTDSGHVDKKINLLESFNFRTSYNMAVDEFNWAPIRIDGRTKLFNRLDVNGDVSLDLYQIDAEGNRINEFQMKKGYFSRLTDANLALGTNLKSKVNQDNKPKKSTAGTEDELDYINSHPGEYVDFNVPWNLNMYYNIAYNKPDTTITITQALDVNGDFSLTSKWKIGFKTGYDFQKNEITATEINVYRDLHCWELRFNWVPFGFRQSFSIDLNVKSFILKDLKLRKQKSWVDNQ